MLAWKRNNSAPPWTAQEAVSYLQKNCQNQNCKTFPTLPVHKLVSLFSYRPTCVWTHNHGYELSFQTTPPHTHPFFFCPVHMDTFWLFALLLTDRLTALAHSQVENKGPAGLLHAQPAAATQGDSGKKLQPTHSSSWLSGCCWLLGCGLIHCSPVIPHQLCRAGAGHHVPSEGCGRGCVLLVTH